MKKLFFFTTIPLSLVYVLLFLPAYLTEGILLFEILISFLPTMLAVNAALIVITGLSVCLLMRVRPTPRLQFTAGIFTLILLTTTASAGLLKVYTYTSPFAKPIQEVQASSSKLNIGFHNKLYSNTEYNELRDAVMQHKLDIIGFGEFLADDYEELKKLLNDYPYSYHTNRFCVQRYECELGLYSKYPWDAVHEHKLPSGDIALEMQFTHHEQNISLFMTHPHAPFSQKNLSARNSQLEALSTLVRSSTAQHVLIMGDFNVTPWSRSYTNFLDSTAKLRDTAQGHLNARTWGISSARLLHLDHIFITKHTKSSPLHIEGTYGSDHNLIWTQLYL